MKFSWFTKKPYIYLDHASATPIDPKVVDYFSTISKTHYANAGAIHAKGLEAKKLLETSRKKIADLLHIRTNEIFFTSGGTESNNLAIFGVIAAFKKNNPGVQPHIVATTIEHASVLEPIRALEKQGVLVTYVPVGEDGIVSAKEIKKALTKNTALVCVMYANNEVGSVQPIRDIAKGIEKWKEAEKSSYPYLFTDACQATNYLSTDISKLHVDLLSCNSSKIYGPKGVGLLYVKSGTLIEPILYGGGQEKNLRSGTESVPLVAAFAQALEKTLSISNNETERLSTLRDVFFKNVSKTIPNIKIWGSRVDRLPNNINISIPGIYSEEIIIGLDAAGFGVSSKSACGMSDDAGSYVILALGGTEQESKESVRITLGRSTTKAHLDSLLLALEHIVERHNKTTYLRQ